MIPDEFIELYYGKYQVLDLHQMTKEEAKVELIHTLGIVDYDIKCLMIVHGYHSGKVIKDFVRKEFKSKEVLEKINFDAGRTLYLLKK